MSYLNVFLFVVGIIIVIIIGYYSVKKYVLSKIFKKGTGKVVYGSEMIRLPRREIMKCVHKEVGDFYFARIIAKDFTEMEPNNWWFHYKVECWQKLKEEKWYIIVCDIATHKHYIPVFSSGENTILIGNIKKSVAVYVSSVVNKITQYEINSVIQLNEDGTKTDIIKELSL
jgi:hypothetical protein